MPEQASSADLREKWRQAIRACDPLRVGGRVISARGLMLTCRLPAAPNDRCEILTGPNTRCQAEVVGFTNDLVYLFLYENSEQVRPNMPVINRGPLLWTNIVLITSDFPGIPSGWIGRRMIGTVSYLFQGMAAQASHGASTRSPDRTRNHAAVPRARPAPRWGLRLQQLPLQHLRSGW